MKKNKEIANNRNVMISVFLVWQQYNENLAISSPAWYMNCDIVNMFFSNQKSLLSDLLNWVILSKKLEITQYSKKNIKKNNM